MNLGVDLEKPGILPTKDAMSGRFQPVNDDHAIEQVVFSLAFARPFNSIDLEAFRLAHTNWADALPAVREPAGFAIVVDAGKGIRAQSAPGVEFAFVRPDGSPVWALRVLGTEIVVECSRYSRWERIWGAASKHLELALEVVGSLNEPNSLIGVTHLVQDGFIAPLEDQDIQQLFVKSDLLPAAIYGRGADWHAHSGWFAQAEAMRTLHNLNVDATSDQAAAAARVTVTHLMTVSREPDVDYNPKILSDWLRRTMTLLHSENKALMAKLLSEPILERIGLKP